jgi:hypothetical protein
VPVVFTKLASLILSFALSVSYTRTHTHTHTLTHTHTQLAGKFTWVDQARGSELHLELRVNTSWMVELLVKVTNLLGYKRWKSYVWLGWAYNPTWRETIVERTHKLSVLFLQRSTVALYYSIYRESRLW